MFLLIASIGDFGFLDFVFLFFLFRPDEVVKPHLGPPQPRMYVVWVWLSWQGTVKVFLYYCLGFCMEFISERVKRLPRWLRFL